MQAPKVNIAALVSYRIYPARMGGQKGIALFYDYLSRLLPVSMIGTKDNDSPENEHLGFFPLLPTSRSRYINPFLFFRIRKFIVRHQITHLIIEHPYYGWLGVLLKRACRIKLVVHSHNIEAMRFRTIRKWWWGILWHYERFTHQQADLNFFIHDDDRQFAMQRFKLNATKCITVTYGFEHSENPGTEEKKAARALVCRTHGIDAGEKLLLFNGTLSYKPNLDALDVILQQINPLLLAEKTLRYKIIICGSKLPADYEELAGYKDKNIVYAGFVADIASYFTGTDIFINPVLDGGGIKTKLVEALGHGLTVITTRSGATGVSLETTGIKMQVIADNDWAGFANSIISTSSMIPTPPAFFDHFYWGNIAARAADAIRAIPAGEKTKD